MILIKYSLMKCSLVNVGTDLKRGVMNVIYNDSDDDSMDEEYGEVNPNAR